MVYTCIFNKEKECPVKQEYKLKPESLVEFCKICGSAPFKVNQNKQQFEMMMQFITTLSDLRHQLGRAEVYKELYLQLKEKSK